MGDEHEKSRGGKAQLEANRLAFFLKVILICTICGFFA